MVNIDNITDDFLIDTLDNSVQLTEDVKDRWPRLSKKERQAFYTVHKKHVSLDASKVLTSVTALVTADGYKDMTDECLSIVTKKQIDRLQDALDDITSNSFWDIYLPVDPLDPDIEVTGHVVDEGNNIQIDIDLP